MTLTSTDMTTLVTQAISTVDDPEYPGISIVDLGLLESVEVDRRSVRIGLIPTFSGCPALTMIAEDVRAALQSLDEVDTVEVQWLRSPAWSSSRVTELGRAALAHEFTVAVQIGSRSTACPRCGTTTTRESLFGPSRCREIHRCDTCRETIEVMRG